MTPTDPGEDTPVKYVPIENAKYTLTERFVDEEGNEISPSVVKGTDYEEGSEYDVTGDAKVIDGYYLKETSNTTGKFGKGDMTATFTYAKLGKIIPVDPEGNPIPDAPTPQYPNNPTDPGKTTPDQPVPEIPGMTPEVPSVTPTDPGKDTEVVYNYDDQKATINYIDETTGQTITSDNVTGKSSTKIAYSTAAKIKELTDKGYVLVSDGFPADATFDNDKNTDQVFDVILKHGEKPVGPTDPHEPDTPINPSDPDGPKWPAKDQYSKDYTSTITYVDDKGNKVADDNVQTSTWTRTLLVDTVTGEVKNPNEAWTANKAQYDAVKSPLVDGYYADKATVAAKDTKQENLTEEVVYRPLGKIIPVDPEGNPIPDAPTPQYPNDPTDPGKTTPDQPVPEIPGYRPEVPSVTPTDPGKDTPVKYIPVTPEKHVQTAKIVYVDTKTGTTIESDSVTGNVGDKIDYSTTSRITELTKKGYILIEDGFTNAGTPVYNDNGEEQVFVVKLGHGTEPVGPNNPHEPGTPINPDDPNGPKWPAKDDYTKQYTSTVHFVDSNGNKLRDDDIQTSTWTRTLIVDKVTGEVLNPSEPWKSDIDDYATVKVPVIEGYYADRATVPGETAQQRDLETTVTYNKIGKIVPVDPNGNPIPNVPTPQYRNDPNDPTKVIVTDTPDIPGMIPETRSVTPGKPGVDTPVVYHKVETPEQKPEQPAQPEVTPVVNGPVQTPAPKAETPATELPQTGDKQGNALAAVGASIVAGMLGLIGFTKKKKDEKDF